jgi:hypothetical protein
VTGAASWARTVTSGCSPTSLFAARSRGSHRAGLSRSVFAICATSVTRLKPSSGAGLAIGAGGASVRASEQSLAQSAHLVLQAIGVSQRRMHAAGPVHDRSTRPSRAGRGPGTIVRATRLSTRVAHTVATRATDASGQQGLICTLRVSDESGFADQQSQTQTQRQPPIHTDIYTHQNNSHIHAYTHIHTHKHAHTYS